MSKHNNIILIGLRGSGKTTIGKMLAKKLNYKFLDKDKMIEKHARKNIEKIISDHGWDCFRDLENEVLMKLDVNQTVISTGGGVVLREDNRSWIKKNGFVIWLKVSPEISWSRIRDDQNRPPLITNTDSLEEIKKVAENREHLYGELADFEINTDHLLPEEACLEIIKSYENK